MCCPIYCYLPLQISCLIISKKSLYKYKDSGLNLFIITENLKKQSVNRLKIMPLEIFTVYSKLKLSDSRFDKVSF